MLLLITNIRNKTPIALQLFYCCVRLDRITSKTGFVNCIAARRKCMYNLHFAVFALITVSREVFYFCTAFRSVSSGQNQREKRRMAKFMAWLGTYTVQGRPILWLVL